MIKGQQKKLEKILYLCAIVFALISIFMIFGISMIPNEITGVKQKIDAGFYGYDIVFGVKDGDIVGLKFSIFALLPYLIVIVGLILTVIKLVSNKLSNKVDYFIVSLFVVALVLFMCSCEFVVFADNLVGKLFNSFDYKISYGLIVSGVSSLISGGCVVANIILRQVKASEKEENN